MLRDLKLEVTLINPNQFRGIGIPDGHFKIPHLWPPKIPQSARTWWAG
jgi:hypothetical protein